MSSEKQPSQKLSPSHLQWLIHCNDPHEDSDNHESNIHRIPLLADSTPKESRAVSLRHF